MTRFSLAALEYEEDKLLAALEEVRVRQREMIRREFIRCAKCGKRSHISSWAFLQCIWRVRPGLNNGGAFWAAAPVKFCYIRCPKCKRENHLYVHAQRERIANLLNRPNVNAETLFALVEKTNTERS